MAQSAQKEKTLLSDPHPAGYWNMNATTRNWKRS